MKYPKPKLFKPSPEQMRVAAEKVAKHLSNDKVLVTQDGQRVRGKKEKTKSE